MGKGKNNGLLCLALYRHESHVFAAKSLTNFGPTILNKKIQINFVRLLIKFELDENWVDTSVICSIPEEGVGKETSLSTRDRKRNY